MLTMIIYCLMKCKNVYGEREEVGIGVLSDESLVPYSFLYNEDFPMLIKYETSENYL